MSELSDFSVLLLNWYDRCAREMPWRGIEDPYKTWVSETMLQQTRVETVLPYYRRFLDRFPTLADLASADEADVLKMWEGLGYYSRARNLLKGARQVMDQFHGKLPRDPDQLIRISGIGPYTAGAIASIAYGIPVPAVDGNVIRVLSRVFGIRDNLSQPSVRKKVEELAAAAVPPERPGDHNQAVMDLGATVCVPGTPDCARCPLLTICDAFKKGDAENLPVLPRSKPPKEIRWTVPVILAGNRTLVRCRTESLLHGLWSFPLLDCDPADACKTLARKYRFNCIPHGETVHARHVFSHLIWEMEVYPLASDAAEPPPADWKWVSLSELDSLAFPAAMNVPLRLAKELLPE